MTASEKFSDLASFQMGPEKNLITFSHLLTGSQVQNTSTLITKLVWLWTPVKINVQLLKLSDVLNENAAC